MRLSPRKRLRSPRQVARRRKMFLWRAGTLLFLGALLLSGGIAGTHIEAIQIQEIVVEGNGVTAKGALSASVQEALDGMYFPYISKRNIFLYPKDAIEEKVLAEFPRLASVTFTRLDTQTLSVQFQEFQPVALYCRESCYFINSTGYIFAPAPEFSGTLLVRFTGGGLVGEPVGAQFVSVGEFKKLLQFIEGVAVRGLAVEHIELLPAGDARALLSSGTAILFSRTISVLVTLENLHASLSSEALSGGLDGVDYIDLRFGNRVYFKKKTEAVPPASDDTQ
ncbi:hypothetical protein COU17_00565 [Candidatus Kaiserbacteria bacterium CG10_big_fil_rev_8_21_14_0_10_49_17]|uniref:POTRA domain-containing protein n=1 Tax=Candidatus Kaiserbacteria bacterium CG10_big_fil_rev_8_21_14_0_10_49_17 TaxID=1974609 RepID=A0A2M6WFA6_9BACT|nr:MAG: hypothetical protein COU17_00565 [Candidatus Kaiserbacteria bacterium CG10_big_fil_rev_8_21_14_0_10_49_17]